MWLTDLYLWLWLAYIAGALKSKDYGDNMTRIREITAVESFRMKFRSETYTYNWPRKVWERRFGNLSSHAVLMAEFPMWKSYVTGHVKPSVAN